MVTAIVWLEVDGELKECRVQSPWADEVLRVNSMRAQVDGKDFRSMTKALADKIVDSGQFAVVR